MRGIVAFTSESPNEKNTTITTASGALCANGTIAKPMSSDTNPMFEERRSPSTSVMRPTTPTWNTMLARPNAQKK